MDYTHNPKGMSTLFLHFLKYSDRSVHPAPGTRNAPRPSSGILRPDNRAQDILAALEVFLADVLQTDEIDVEPELL